MTAAKDDKGKKYRPDLLDPQFLLEWSEVLAFGAKKYSEEGWREGHSLKQSFAAMLRHIYSAMSGEDRDKETGLPHILHAACCLMFVWWAQFGPKAEEMKAEGLHNLWWQEGGKEVAQPEPVKQQKTRSFHGVVIAQFSGYCSVRRYSDESILKCRIEDFLDSPSSQDLAEILDGCGVHGLYSVTSGVVTEWGLS